MRKYIGKYRVLIERDIITGEPMEFTYIVGTKAYKNMKAYRFDENTIVLHVPTTHTNSIINRVSNELKIKIKKSTEYSGEIDIYIDESDLYKANSIFKFKTSGANFKPESVKNNPRYKEIKQEKRDNMTEDELNILRNRFKSNISIG